MTHWVTRNNHKRCALNAQDWVQYCSGYQKVHAISLNYHMTLFACAAKRVATVSAGSLVHRLHPQGGKRVRSRHKTKQPELAANQQEA